MQIVHNVNIHLDRREQLPAIDAVQGETGRVLSVTLFDKGELWPIPDNARAVVRYGKDDFTGGIYDTLPDGEADCAISGSTVICRGLLATGNQRQCHHESQKQCKQFFHFFFPHLSKKFIEHIGFPLHAQFITQAAP